MYHFVNFLSVILPFWYFWNYRNLIFRRFFEIVLLNTWRHHELINQIVPSNETGIIIYQFTVRVVHVCIHWSRDSGSENQWGEWRERLSVAKEKIKQQPKMVAFYAKKNVTWLTQLLWRNVEFCIENPTLFYAVDH